MEVIWIMIPISILLAFSFLAVFILASKNKQFDDLESPPRRMLFEDKAEDIDSQKLEGENV